MKKLCSLLLAALMLLSLCACARNGQDTPETTTEPPMDVTASDADVAQLDALYAGKTPYHGELHDHADTGGTSDGNSNLKAWKDSMVIQDMDFSTFADHRQVLHMRLEDWDNSMFIGGTEAATNITDSKAAQNNLHYNMLFAEPEPLEEVLNTYPVKYQYLNDHFQYPNFTSAEFSELAELVLDKGGFLVHVHPKGDSYMLSDDPLDYWFADGMGLEVLCGYYGNMNELNNQEAYQLWTELLRLGKRVYATSGSDSHRLSKTVSLTTVYSEKLDAKTLLDHVRAGNFTAGPGGIRMCVGDTPMGGETSFAGKRVVVSVGDLHSKEYRDDHRYSVRLYNEEGLVCEQEFDPTQTAYIAIDADPSCKLYRAEIYDMLEGYIFALGNPVWNQQIS